MLSFSVRRRPSALAALLAALLAAPRAARAQRTPRQELREVAPPLRVDTVAYSRLRYRYIGPEGNRITSVAGVAGDPYTYYAGAASGGVFKSTDGGVHWQPVFDGQPVSSIGALAVAPSDPNVVWVGTGEPFIRSHISVGWGVYRSTDAGRSWTRMGLDATGRIARVVVDPRDPDRVYVAALGHAYGPQPERGIYRTTDGGRSWRRVLFVNDSTGASDLVMDPNNPRILYAGMWQLEIHTWGRTSGGAGSGIWRSTDGGESWTRLTGHGLPTKPVGKIGLAMSRANSSRVYALIETGDGVPALNVPDPDRGRLFRSDDGGASWQLVSHDRQVAGRTHYYNRMGVEPDNPDEAYFLAASWSKTVDGGRTILDPPPAEVPGGDHHDIWIDPTAGDRMIVSHDGGVSITTNRGRSWLQVQLPVAQMYHVAVDNKIPYNVYGNRQDGPSTMGPSNSRLDDGRDDGGIPRGLWHSVGGGESGWATPDTVDGHLVWSSASGSGSVGGIVTRYDVRTNQSRSVEIWPRSTIGWPAESLAYRFVWTFPLTVSPHDHHTLYAGSQYVHVTTDEGRTWRVISPDLTRNDKSRQRVSGGLTPDNIGVEYAGVVFALAESPRARGTIWAGTNDGRVHVTRDGGRTWTDVSANIPGLLAWGTISNIEPSRFDAATAYLTVDGHQVNNRDPWVYRTTDYGATWRLITAGLAHTPLSYAHVVREDPARRGLLYLGTEGGLSVSFDDGARWQPLQNNLPHAPVYWITVQEHFGDLVVATYGRGFWILDDLTPLREIADDALRARRAYLFAPRVAYRFLGVEAPMTPWYDPVAGRNPPYGASINYWLRTGSDSTGRPAPDRAGGARAADGAGRPVVVTDSVELTISDASGAVVRRLKGPANAGLNRVWWDLRHERTREARLRTSPEDAPWVEVGLQGKPAPLAGLRYAILAPPGTYTVTLAAGDQRLTQPLVVRKDPAAEGTEESIREQMVTLRAITADADTVVAMINALEAARGQLAALRATLAADSARAGSVEARAAADSLDGRLLAVERTLFQTRVTGRGQDAVRWPTRLAEQLLYLAGSVGGSDVAPTASQRAVQHLLHEHVQAARAAFERVMRTDLGAFNELLRRMNLQSILAAAAGRRLPARASGH